MCNILILNTYVKFNNNKFDLLHCTCYFVVAAFAIYIAHMHIDECNRMVVVCVFGHDCCIWR